MEAHCDTHSTKTQLGNKNKIKRLKDGDAASVLVLTSCRQMVLDLIDSPEHLLSIFIICDSHLNELLLFQEWQDANRYPMHREEFCVFIHA